MTSLQSERVNKRTSCKKNTNAKSNIVCHSLTWIA